MTDWYWDICPRCGGMGTIPVRTWVARGTSDSDHSDLITEDRPCGACDDLGRVKVPTGYHLTPDAVTTTTVSNTTSPVKVLG